MTPLARHVLSEEEQKWLDKITAAVRNYAISDDGVVDPKAEEALAATLRGVAHDASTQHLSAHLCALVATEVNASLRSLPRLTATLRLLSAMLRSLTLVLEPYLHQLMPAVLTCLLGKRLCASPLEDHWALRRHAAALVGAILARFRDKYADLQPRVCKTLLDALSDPKRPLSTHYGALVGLHELGPLVVHTLLMPSLPKYLAELEAALSAAPAAAGGAAEAATAKAGGGVKAPPPPRRSGRRGSWRRLAARAAMHVCGIYFRLRRRRHRGGGGGGGGGGGRWTSSRRGRATGECAPAAAAEGQAGKTVPASAASQPQVGDGDRLGRCGGPAGRRPSGWRCYRG